VVVATVDADGAMRYLGSTASLAGTVRAMAYDEGFLYVGAGERQILVIDPRDASAPELVAKVDVAPRRSEGSELTDMEVIGDTLYAVGGDGQFHVVDIADPREPWLLASLATGFLDPNLPRGGELIVVGGYAYVRDREGINVIDLGDRHRPRRIARYERPVTTSTRAMFLLGEQICLLERNSLRFIDISLPARPRQSAEIPLQRLVDGVVVGQRLYLLQEGRSRWTSTPEGPREVFDPGFLFGYDISDPSRPFQRSSREVGAARSSLFAGRGALYLVELEGAMQRYSLADPDAPVEAGRLEAELALRVAVDQDRAALVLQNPDTDRLRLELVDVADPAAPAALASFDLPEPPIALALEGALAYTLYEDRLAVIDFSRPQSSTLAAEVGGLEHAAGLRVDGQRSLVTQQEPHGLRIFDWQDAGLRARGAVTLTEAPAALLTRANLAYVASGIGLEVVDFSDPDAPIRRGQTSQDDPGGYPGPIGRSMPSEHLAWSGDRILGAGANSVLVFDVDDPDRPVTASRSLFGPIGGLAADEGGFIFTIHPQASGSLARSALMVSQLGKSEIRGGLWSQNWPARFHDLVWQDERLYVAAGAGGLIMLDPVPPERLPMLLTPRPSATAPPLPTATARPGDAERPYRLYLPALQRPVPKSARSLRLLPLASAGGRSGIIAARGPAVYLQEGNQVAIYDTSDAKRHRRLGELDLPMGPAPEWWQAAVGLPDLEWSLVDLQIDGDRLLVLIGPDPAIFASGDMVDQFADPRSGFRPTSRLLSFDLSDPTRPLALDRIDLRGMVTGLSVAEGRGAVILLEDLSEDMRSSSRLTAFSLDGGRIRLGGSLGIDRFLTRIDLQGSLLTVLGYATDEGGFEVILVDGRDIAQPVQYARLPIDFWPSSFTPAMVVGDGFLALFSEFESVVLVDIRSPRAPIQLESINLQELLWGDDDPDNDIFGVSDALLDGNTVILHDRVSGVMVTLDSTAPSGLVATGSLRLPSAIGAEGHSRPWLPRRMVKAGGRLYVAGDGTGGLAVIELGPPLAQVGASESLGVLQAVAAGRDRVYTVGAQGITVFDADALPEFEPLGGVDAGSIEVLLNEGLNELALDQSRLLLARFGGVDWLEFASPSAPLRGSFDADRRSERDVAGAGDRVYVVEEQGGLIVYALDDEGGDPIRGRYNGPGVMRDVAVDGALQRAYVAAGPAGLSLLDVADPSQIRELAFVDPGGYAAGVAVEGALGVVLTSDPMDRDGGGSALVTLDLGLPNPQVLGRLALPTLLEGDPQLAGGLVLLRLQDGRLWIVDISVPARPTLALELRGSWRSVALSPSADRLYTVGEHSGQLTVWRLQR
jgi:hypothetical protein